MFIKKKKFINTFSFLISTKYLILMCLKWETMVSKFCFVIDQCFCCTFFFFSIRVFFYGHWRFTICPNSPVLNGGLPLSEGSARPPVYYWNLTFWDDPGLNVRYLWIFQVDHIFYKLDVKILATSNEIRCVRCSYPPSSSWTVDPCQ